MPKFQIKTTIINNKTFLAPLMAVVLVALTWNIGLAQTAKSPEKPDANATELLETFVEVYNKVKSSYVDETRNSDLVEKAIRGMLLGLDPHSDYLSEDGFKDLRVQTKGEFGGLGLEVVLDTSGAIRVVSPIDDTPAARAGVQSGDLITHLDHKLVQGKTLQEAVDIMRGKIGTEITLTIFRKGAEPFNVTLRREKIVVQSVKSDSVHEFGYIRISSFTEQTTAGIAKAIEKLKKDGKNPQGYIIDLRNNPGGLLDQAIEVSDLFLDSGEIVSTRGREKRDDKRFLAKRGDAIEGAPIVVIINGGSASASEIVAGALQDQKRAIIVGTKSFGKGSVQTILPLKKSGTAIKLTTQRYFTPSGRSIQATGIEPDINIEQLSVKSLENNLLAIREADLENALKNNDNKNPDTKIQNKKDEKKEEKKDDKKDDYQLNRAVDILRALVISKQWQAK